MNQIKSYIYPLLIGFFRHNSSVLPPFIELDMSAEGFGCLYLPSIAPQSPAGPGVVTGALLSADNNVIGGIGSGDRIFPPQTGTVKLSKN